MEAIKTASTWLFGEDTELKQFQQESISAFLEGKDIFISQPTGSGKSAVFQLLPVVSHIRSHKSVDTVVDATVLVIQPLISLIEDQIQALKARGMYHYQLLF